MKRLLLHLLLCFLIISCQKGIHWDIASEGSLVKDYNGNCLPVSINGSYIEDSITTGNNFITVDVNVTGIGTYNIFTDSINGYVFKASGEFNNSGTNHVKLLCSGKPAMADTNYLTIHYNTSVCEATIIVKSNAIPTAAFSLQGAPGKCLNDTVIGTYAKGVVLDTSYKVNISVNVTTPGRYDITTDVVNGYSFTAAGIFATTGMQTVIMYPKGAPQKEGTDIFNVKSASSECSLEVNVKSDAAEFTLHGSPGKCMYDTVIGTYVKGIFLETFSSTVTIGVDVTFPGKYTITTNNVNGYSFIASGVFATTGVQAITMNARGTPLNAGTDIFSITAGVSSCNFEVTVLQDIVAVSSNDYFPLTDSSYWIYDDLFTKGNIINRSITGTSSVNDTVYKVMQQSDNYNITEQYLFRRDAVDYLEYTRTDKYTGSFQYAISSFTQLLFLTQNIQQGTYWGTPELGGMTNFNQEIILQYNYLCIKSNAVVTVNGRAFANVCIIEMRPQIHAFQNPWGATNEIYTYYYAKGIGLIYFKAVTNYGYKKAEMQLKSWLVK